MESRSREGRQDEGWIAVGFEGEIGFGWEEDRDGYMDDLYDAYHIIHVAVPP